MHRINFDFSLVDLDGNDVPEAKVAKILAREIAISSGQDDPVKFLDFALSLQKNGFVDVDTSDKRKLEEFIKASKTMTTIMMGSALKAIASAVDLDKEKKSDNHSENPK